MSVRILTGWTDADWDAEVTRHREATLFHTRLWARICCRSFSQLRDRSLWVEVTTKSGSSRHLLPLLEWRRAAGLITTIHCTFPHIYGGPLPTRGAGGESVLPHVLGFLATLRGTVLLTANPLAERFFDQTHPERSGTGREARAGAWARPEGPAEAPPGAEARPEVEAPPAPVAVSPGSTNAASSSPGWEWEPDSTHLRTLPETDAEFWDDELPPRRRNDVRRLTKKGVSIEESRERADVSRLYQLYQASFARWGGRPAFLHPETLYQNLVEMGGESVRLSVARFEGQVIGGVLALRFGAAVHYFAGYFDAEAKALRPNVLLQVDSIRQAISDGFAFYDFLPSGGNENVEQFKEGFGGRRVEVPVWRRRSFGHRLLARARGR